MVCSLALLVAPVPAAARLEAGVERALARGLPSEGLAIVVTLATAQIDKASDRRAEIHAAQQRVLDALPPGSFRIKHRHERIAGFAGWAQPAALEALAAHPDVALVYLDGRVQRALAEGVPLVGAAVAHTEGYTGAGITAAVIDTGIDASHPDLSDDLVAEACFCDDQPSPNRGCCPNGRATQFGSGAAADSDGHGTSVAGIITAGGVQSAPGVAPDAQIAAIRVFSATGGGLFSDIDAALGWVLANHDALHIRLVNLSLGDGGQYADPTVSPCSGSNTADAVASLAAAGVAVFAASGNEGFDAGVAFPACIPDVISVGGVYDANVGPASWCANSQCSAILCTDNPTAADKFVCHANSGPLLDLLAPDWRTDAPQKGGGTHAFGGTSASCPYAVGQAALLLQAAPSLLPAALRSLMKAHGPLITNPASGLSFRRTDVASALATLIDRDGDGLVDADEVNLYGTDPLVADTDGDGFSDGAEVAAGSDPKDPSSVPRAVPASPPWAQALAALALIAAAHAALRRRAGVRS
jgi:subtilisin family serine protease